MPTRETEPHRERKSESTEPKAPGEHSVSGSQILKTGQESYKTASDIAHDQRQHAVQHHIDKGNKPVFTDSSIDAANHKHNDAQTGHKLEKLHEEQERELPAGKRYKDMTPAEKKEMYGYVKDDVLTCCDESARHADSEVAKLFDGPPPWTKEMKDAFYVLVTKQLLKDHPNLTVESLNMSDLMTELIEGEVHKIIQDNSSMPGT